MPAIGERCPMDHRRSARERSRGGRTAPRVSRSQRRLVAAAFHEAGHAVAAYHAGVRFRRVAIGHITARELGWLELWLTPRAAPDGAVDIRAEQAIGRSVIVLLAGSQAERMALGRAKYFGSGLDFFEALRYAGYLGRTRAEMSAYLRWMQFRVRTLVHSPTWRQPIEALAACLVQRREVGVHEARRIIRRAMPTSPDTAERRTARPRG